MPTLLARRSNPRPRGLTLLPGLLSETPALRKLPLGGLPRALEFCRGLASFAGGSATSCVPLLRCCVERGGCGFSDCFAPRDTLPRALLVLAVRLRGDPTEAVVLRRDSDGEFSSDISSMIIGRKLKLACDFLGVLPLEAVPGMQRQENELCCRSFTRRYNHRKSAVYIIVALNSLPVADVRSICEVNRHVP
jgi:hypothetical protein